MFGRDRTYPQALEQCRENSMQLKDERKLTFIVEE